MIKALAGFILALGMVSPALATMQPAPLHVDRDTLVTPAALGARTLQLAVLFDALRERDRQDAAQGTRIASAEQFGQGDLFGPTQPGGTDVQVAIRVQVEQASLEASGHLAAIAGLVQVSQGRPPLVE